MNRKQYMLYLIVYGIISLGLIITNAIFSYFDSWLGIFVVVSVGYFYIRYKITAPLQSFAKRFNMMIDYDLDVEGALSLVKKEYENAPTKAIESMFRLYLGMAYYYNGEYNEAIKTFNQIPLNKVNQVYHILIFAFTAYSAYELKDQETFDIALERIENAKDHVGKKFISFAYGYVEILKAMKNMETDPEHFREIIEKNYSKDDGYISTKLIYNYRMAQYYEVLNNVEEMDKCLAACIANGKNHHVALQAKKMFKNTCKVEDYIFKDSTEEESTNKEDNLVIDQNVDLLEKNNKDIEEEK